MSTTKKMTLRVQSAEGTARVELEEAATATALHEAVRLALGAGGPFALHLDRARRQPLPAGPKRLKDLGLRHGDLLFLSPLGDAPRASQSTDDPMKESVKRQEESTGAVPSETPVEDDVDLELYQMSGNIQRQRDEKLCRHNSKGCCVHCSPLEPWDEGYLRDHNIKHMSFHAYLRKITAGKFVSLNELSCKIKPGCKEHPPWPRGICSSCQPGAVTLTRQPYRHVDNVLVEHPALVERFLAYWRATGHQRLGFLYGRYERHPDVPLGIRARVAAIYEPPQASGRDFVQLQPDPKEPLLQRLASRLGLRRVGWIFTDLLPDDVAAGTVKHIRGGESHFLSAQECITAGHYQNLHPNACRHAALGHFGSKFVTVCVTGDASQQVHLEGYQVSGQCAALVRDSVLLPTRDAPDLGYIRDSADAQYVPDVYYKERDPYGNEVGVSAKRLPVAYLLVDVPCGVANAPAAATFSPRASFPPAHRPLQKHLQTLRALHDHLRASPSFLEAASDLHVLLYMATNEALPLPPDELDPLLAAVAARDEAAAEAWRRGPLPATLDQLAQAAASEPAQGARASGAEGGVWTCQLCTFHNAARRDACEMCAMPRNSGM